MPKPSRKKNNDKDKPAVGVILRMSAAERTKLNSMADNYGISVQQLLTMLIRYEQKNQMIKKSLGM